MTFHTPYFLLLLPLLFPVWWYLRRRDKSEPVCLVADSAQVASLPVTFKVSAERLLRYWPLPVMGLLIVSLARPQMVRREETTRVRAADIMVVLDISSSMLAIDSVGGASGKSRLKAAKEVLDTFVGTRSGDRIGLIAFAARAYQAAPLTLDHIWLKRAFDHLEVGAIEDGTAIGDGVTAALKRLQKSRNNSRAVILITDGRNNTGVSPLEAASAAAALGIKVHAIGIGSRGKALFPVADPLGGVMYRSLEADLDEAALKSVAAATGGAYFRADDQEGLYKVLGEISRLEKQPVEQKLIVMSSDIYQHPLLISLLLYVAAGMLQLTALRRVH